MNRNFVYQNASAIVTYLLGSDVGTIISLDVFPSMVQLHIHLPREKFVVGDVQKMISPFLIGSPKFNVTDLVGVGVEVLHVEWDDLD